MFCFMNSPNRVQIISQYKFGTQSMGKWNEKCGHQQRSGVPYVINFSLHNLSYFPPKQAEMCFEQKHDNQQTITPIKRLLINKNGVRLIIKFQSQYI
jgi:hypothetical protein